MARRRTTATDAPATYRDVLSVREFRYLFGSDVVSLLGDQALRVALALFVYGSTKSPLLTTFAYALTFLPWVLAGPVLTRYADRTPRRSMLVYGNLARAGVVALMAIPHVPVGWVLVLVLVAETMAPPVQGAYFALLPDILPGDRYVVGISMVQAASQAAQIIGFAIGGVIVAASGARAAFGFDAVTFAVSAGLIAIALRQPYPPPPIEHASSWWEDTKGGFRVSLGSPLPRTLLLLAWWAAAILLVPEALAAPFVTHTVHGGDTQTGWLLAAQPLGMIVGILVLGRLVRPALRLRLIRPLALIAMVPLVGFVFSPSYGVAWVLLLFSGAAWSFQVPLQGQFIDQIPAEARGRAFGVAASGLQVSQGIGVLLGGLLAELFGVTPAIAGVGIVGVVVMLGLVLIRVPGPAPAEPQVVAAAT